MWHARRLTLRHDISRIFRVSLYGEPAVAEVAFAPESEDGRRVIIADFLLLGVVADAHADVVVACPTTERLQCHEGQ